MNDNNIVDINQEVTNKTINNNYAFNFMLRFIKIELYSNISH